MSTKRYWKVTYLSILSGERETYMNIGFESPERAQRTIDQLIKEYDKRWSEYCDDKIRQMYIDGTVMYTPMIGREYKVELIKLRLL